MHPFKKNIFKTSDDETIVVFDFCATWSAQNESNIRMSTSGLLDFTLKLAGKNIDTTPGLSVGAISAYKFAGDPTWVSASIPFSFTLKKATWNTNALPVRSNQVLTGIRFSYEIITTPYSELSASNIELFAEVTGSPQLIASYDSCPEVQPVQTFSFRRDGSQIEGNPSFHIPYVDYIAEDFSTQRIYISMTDDACEEFEGREIVDRIYVFEC
jgi:hypothetical protein